MRPYGGVIRRVLWGVGQVCVLSLRLTLLITLGMVQGMLGGMVLMSALQRRRRCD